MRNLLLSISVGVAAAFLMLGNTNLTIKNIDQLGATQPSIEELLAQLKSLQAQLAAKQAQVVTTYQFTRVLKVGDKGEDVRQLQILLNKDTLTQIAVSGDGSPGKETTYFGLATSRAVSKFQEKYKSEILTPNKLTKGTGTVGNATLKKLNVLIAVTKTTGTPGNVAVITNNPNVTNTTPTQTNTTGTTTQTNTTPTQTNTTSTSSSLLPPTNCGAPLITSATSASGTVGSSFTYNISITSIAAPTFSATGLPAGLTLSGSRISGTPTTAGTYTTTITATSNCGTGSKVVTITISAVTPPVASGAIITPGNGFSGATAQPSAVGSGFGSDANTIAHWDTVPYQTFSSTMNIAVVAFHINDIDHVVFSANGGPWTNVYSMTLNPETNVVEYWATLRASDFDKDGIVEVRAIAYPKIGIPRVLQGTAIINEGSSLLVNVNGKGTLAHSVRYVSKTGDDTNDCLSLSTACLTISKAIDKASTAGLGSSIDGAEIRLGEGSWTLPALIGSPAWMPAYSTDKQWLVITSAPGTNTNNVQINGMDGASDGNGLGVGLVRLYNLSTTGFIGKAPVAYKPSLWLDHVFTRFLDQNFLCDSAAAGPVQGWGNWSGGVYYTDVQMYNTGWGPTGTILARNVYAERTASGHASGAATLINYSVKTVDGGFYKYPSGCSSGDIHGDIYQLDYHRTNDVILYGISLVPGFSIRSSRGIASGWSSKDIAVVNVDLSSMGGWTFSAGGCRNNIDNSNVTMNNWFIKDSKFGAGDWCGEAPQYFTVDPSFYSNIAIKNSTFNNGHAEMLPYPINIPAIKYINAGSGITTSWNTTTNMPISFTITATAESNGSITPSGTVTYLNSGNTVYTITPNANYQIEDVKVDGVSQGAISSYTFPSVSSNHTISATFKAFQAITNVPTNGLVGYWPMNENTGTTITDASGNGNNGTLTNTVTWTTGKFGPGLHFDGTGGFGGSYINIGKTGSNNLPVNNPVSISAWVKYPVGGSGVIVSTIDAGAGGGSYELNASGFCSHTSNGNGCVSISSPTSGWHHLVGIGTDSLLTLYVDNVPTTGTNFNPYDTSLGVAGKNVTIGANWNGSPQTSSMDIDDVRIYNRALLSTEVQQLFNGTLAFKTNQSFTASVWNGFVGTMTSIGSSILDILTLR